MAINIKFELSDNTDEYIQLFEQAVDRALERCGMQAESYATDLAPVGTPESTGIEGYSIFVATCGVNTARIIRF